jgi:hypothetical protein
MQQVLWFIKSITSMAKTELKALTWVTKPAVYTPLE